MRRGFKSQCEKRSTEIRRKLGLAAHAPLLASALAENQGVTIWSEADITEVDKVDLDCLSGVGRDAWSAFTLRVGEHHLVVFNSAQAPPRVNSVVMHELAHILLGHELTSASLSEDGCFVPTNYDQEQEDEADWFAGTLLLPRPALLAVRSRKISDDVIMERYAVSRQMLNWRVRMTGVDYQLKAGRRSPA